MRDGDCSNTIKQESARPLSQACGVLSLDFKHLARNSGGLYTYPRKIKCTLYRIVGLETKQSPQHAEKKKKKKPTAIAKTQILTYTPFCLSLIHISEPTRPRLI
eukprot:5724406-Amphidinium_carterae.1